MTVEIRIDRELCIGSENCRRYAPAIFDTDADGKAFVKPDATLDESSVLLAVSGCPMSALSIVE